MPRMGKAKKKEMAIFLNHKNRITYNKRCRTCKHDCKQSFRAELIACPKYERKGR